MTINDPVGDMLTRIRNAQMRGMSKTSTPASKLRQRVLDVLETEGFIRGYTRIEHADKKTDLEIELKYFDGEPVISKIKRISKPGRRVYSSVREIEPVQNGLGISILSTPKGVMSDAVAREHNVGGEVLCHVY